MAYAFNDDKSKVDLLDFFYPIGTIYTSVVSTNPSELFGGTWVKFGSGKTIVGVDQNDTAFNTVEKSGGEKSHKLTVNEMPSHTHKPNVATEYFVTSELADASNGDVATKNTTQNIINTIANYHSAGIQQSYIHVDGSGAFHHRVNTQTIGGNQTHNNLQPYITVYMWKRTA